MSESPIATAEIAGLRSELVVVLEQRNAAERKYVAAREEASELEQEMADLRAELGFTKLMLDRDRAQIAALILDRDSEAKSWWHRFDRFIKRLAKW
jgi:predicted  nucleic acid-binding Zn-ribbon protein